MSRTDMYSRSQRKASKRACSWIKLSLRLLSVRLLSFLLFWWLSDLAWQLTYNCELHPLPNVKIYSIMRNAFVSPAKLGFALYISLHKLKSIDNFRKFCTLCHKQVIACFLVKLSINITCVFRICRNCPCRFATPAISANSENTSDINP